jgi:hypothetical protein
VVFNYDNGNVAMNMLAEKTGFSWYVDKDKKLHFIERIHMTAPYSVDDSTALKSFRVKRNKKFYRNRQFVQAGVELTSTILLEKPTPKPDGVSRTFVTRLPVGLKPTIVIDGTPVDDNDVGVNGLDQNKEWYFSYNSNIITQDTSLAPLETDDTIEITYQGLFPIFVVSENPAEIATRIGVEGGSGVYENIIEEKTLDGRDAAFQFAEAKLDKYGFIPRVITFDIYEHGLKAGQLITIENTVHGIDDSFLIESVTTRDMNGLTVYSVKCLDGSALGGWEQLFKGLVTTKKQLVIREGEVLVLIFNVPSETQNWSEELTTPTPTEDEETSEWAEDTTPTVYACPIPSEDLYPADDLYPC